MLQILDQEVPHLVKAEPIEKSNSFEEEAPEIKAKIEAGEVELFEDIKNVSSKETIVSDGNDSDSSFGDIGSENEVRKPFKV